MKDMKILLFIIEFSKFTLIFEKITVNVPSNHYNLVQKTKIQIIFTNLFEFSTISCREKFWYENSN